VSQWQGKRCWGSPIVQRPNHEKCGGPQPSYLTTEPFMNSLARNLRAAPNRRSGPLDPKDYQDRTHGSGHRLRSWEGSAHLPVGPLRTTRHLASDVTSHVDPLLRPRTRYSPFRRAVSVQPPPDMPLGESAEDRLSQSRLTTTALTPQI